MFLAEIGKIMYTPVNTSFTIYKWGLMALKFYRYVFVMEEAMRHTNDKTTVTYETTESRATTKKTIQHHSERRFYLAFYLQ